MFSAFVTQSLIADPELGCLFMYSLHLILVISESSYSVIEIHIIHLAAIKDSSEFPLECEEIKLRDRSRVKMPTEPL